MKSDSEECREIVTIWRECVAAQLVILITILF